ncbi:MAG: peptidoglycan DD-metalloendopeptidase family protein [Pseudoflavonifractor sp.]
MAEQQKKKKKEHYWTPQRMVVAALALIMALLMILPMIGMIVGNVGAASTTELQDQIKSLKSSAGEYKSKKSELKAQLKAVQGQKADAMQEKAIRDQELAYIDQEVANTQQQIAYYGDLIAQESANLALAKEKEADQYALFCKRVRAMEETGNASYFSILFSAENFSDLLSRAVDIQDIMDYDNAVIDQLQKDREAVAATLASLENAQTEQEAQKANLDAQRAEQKTKVAQAAQLVSTLEKDKEALQKQLDAQAAEEAAVAAQIAKKQKELEEKIRQNQIKFSISGDYLYPLPAGYNVILSKFGWRTHPITGRPNNHTGIDIPAPKNTPIYATKSGVVTISERGSSYGNYVVVSHGDGTSSLCAHMNSRNVSEGAVVKQGDIIGYVGTTGNSTGNHLHLEIRVNGQRQNPENYYPNMNFDRQY